MGIVKSSQESDFHMMDALKLPENIEEIDEKMKHYCYNKICYLRHPIGQTECPIKNQECNTEIINPYYSNQGEAGTCTRHAIAKGVLYFINNLTGNRILFSVDSLVTAILNARQKYGGKGANPTSWNEAKITVTESNGNVFDITLEIKEEKNNENIQSGSIVVVDLRNLLKQYINENEQQLHAMFVLSHQQDALYLINSWGPTFSWIKFKKNNQDHFLIGYSIKVKILCWRRKEKEEEDFFIIKDTVLVQDEKWEKKWNSNLEEQLKKQINIIKKGIYCQVCGNGFRNYEQTILTIVFGLKEKKYYCSDCKIDQSFEYRESPQDYKIISGINCKECGVGTYYFQKVMSKKIFRLQSYYSCSNCQKNTQIEYSE